MPKHRLSVQISLAYKKASPGNLYSYCLHHPKEMFRPILAMTLALIAATQATSIPSCSDRQCVRTVDGESEASQLSTEGIIGIVGVVVALLGIASSLAWSKRRKSRSRSRRTSEGIHMSRFLHFEKVNLICFTRIDTLQPSDVWQCFYAIVSSQYLGAHS
jgi:hypothetical protein